MAESKGARPIPVILLGKFGLVFLVRECGLGRDLLADVLRRRTFLSETLPARVLVVEPVDVSAES